MKLVINGRDESLDFAPATILGLLDRLNIKPGLVIVELNGSVFKAEDFSGITLNPNDRLEIVHYVGGGSHMCKSSFSC